MKLPIPFISGKKNNESYYLALLLAEEKISSVILQEHEGKLKIVGMQESALGSSLEHLSQDELIDWVDKTISRAEEVLPPDVETHKTVFGVKESWVDKETKKIKKEYLAKLKKVCDALELSPIGFMVTSEAIANLLQEEEGAPLSAILAEIGKKHVTLTLFRGGNIIQTVDGVIEGTCVASVDRLLKHFTIEVLPARIILYDSDTTEELAQKFISHQWSKSLPFLHMPQVSVLPVGFDARAVTNGAGEQMGLSVLGTTAGIVKTYEHNTSGVEHQVPVETVPEAKVTESLAEEEAVELSSATVSSNTGAEAFGFVIGEDIALRASVPAESRASSHPVAYAEEVTEEAEEKVLHGHVSDNLRMPEDIVNKGAIEEDEEEEEREESSRRSDKRGPIWAGVLQRLSAIRLPRFGGGNKMRLVLFLLPVFVLLLLVIGSVVFYLYQVKATVHLTIKPNIVNADQPVTFSADTSTDFSKKVISAKEVHASVDGTLTENATGTDEVGDKAKGTVTLYNSSTDGEARVSAGTTITSATGVKFVLDKDVKVASASGDIFSGTKPGTADVSVTASDIGTEGNLPSGTKFSVSGNSTLAGKNGSAFSGGSKKNVTVVSKNDLTNVRSHLEDELTGKAKDELVKQANGGEVVLPIVMSSKLMKESFDKKTEDQAKSVTMNGTVSFTGLAYTQEDLLSYAKVSLKNQYSDDVLFADNSVTADLKDPKAKDSAITATVHMEAGLLPKLSAEDLARQLSGKSRSEVEETLSHLPQVSSHEVTYSPSLFFLPSLLPQLPKQVSVVIEPQH